MYAVDVFTNSLGTVLPLIVIEYELTLLAMTGLGGMSYINVSLMYMTRCSSDMISGNVYLHLLSSGSRLSDNGLHCHWRE